MAHMSRQKDVAPIQVPNAAPSGPASIEDEVDRERHRHIRRFHIRCFCFGPSTGPPGRKTLHSPLNSSSETDEHFSQTTDSFVPLPLSGAAAESGPSSVPLGFSPLMRCQKVAYLEGIHKAVFGVRCGRPTGSTLVWVCLPLLTWFFWWLPLVLARRCG